jgi:hypothetical protein
MKSVTMRLQEWLTRWLTRPPAVLVTFGLGVALLGGGVAAFLGGHPDPGLATAGVGIAAVGLGFALLGDVWPGISVVGVGVVMMLTGVFGVLGVLVLLVPGDLGGGFGVAMMGAGVGVVVAGAISRTSQVWVGITTLTGGVVTGAGAFVLVLRGNGFGVVGFVLSVALVGVGVAMLVVGIAVVASGAVMAGSARLKRCLPQDH